MKKRVVFGLPLTPRHLLEQVRGSSFCVSYWTRQCLGKQLDQAINLVGEDEVLLVDNGAFSAWKAGVSVSEDYWDEFATWAHSILIRCPQAVVVVPDVINGSEDENNELLLDFISNPDIPIAIERMMPVWHMHESINRLLYLVESCYAYIGIGSSGEYAVPGTHAWHSRISEALKAINSMCASSNGAFIRPWIHMMRAQAYAHMYDFDSSDSTNLAVNHHKHRNVENHVNLYARRIVDRVRYSCDGLERRSILSPKQQVLMMTEDLLPLF